MKLLIFVFLVITVSCSTDNVLKYHTAEFPQEQELTYTTIATDVPSKYILGIYVKDSILLVQGNDGNHCFFAYHKNTGKYIRPFFQIGRGPFEGVSPGFIETPGDSCLITESNLRKGYFFSLSGLLNGNPDFFREFNFRFPEERAQMMANHPVMLAENKYLLTVPFSAAERFAVYTNPYTEGKKEIKHISRTYPKITEEPDAVNAAILQHINQYAVSPDGTKLVHLSFVGAIAETFEIGKDTLRPIAIKGFLRPEYQLMGSGISPANEGMIGFGDVIASDDYFYAIYYNTPYNKDNLRTIAVFDWDLKPVRSYTVKDRILYMTSDPHTGYVYAVVNNRETHEYDIIKFDESFIR